MATALSEYEQQRLKNMEENRRILESIRQEQVGRCCRSYDSSTFFKVKVFLDSSG